MSRQPAIYITAADYDCLFDMVPHHEIAGTGPALLSHELDRAHVVTAASRRRFVRLGSTVTYEDEKTGRQREVRLVLPRDADIDRGLVSVLSPVGAALIGLPVGPVFRWEDREGRTHGVRILAIA